MFTALYRYDLIGKYESLPADSAIVLDKIGAPVGLTFPEAKISETGGLLSNYMQRITTDQKRQLLELYAEDLLLFGYTYRDKGF